MRPRGGELGGEVAEVTRLLGAAAAGGDRVEEQHHRAVLEQGAQAARGPGLVGQLEVGYLVADVHTVSFFWFCFCFFGGSGTKPLVRFT